MFDFVKKKFLDVLALGLVSPFGPETSLRAERTQCEAGSEERVGPDGFILKEIPMLFLR